MSDEYLAVLEIDQRLEDIVLDYLKAVDAGQAPSRDELLARYPEVATELEAFFGDEDRCESLSRPLKAAMTPDSRTESRMSLTSGLEATPRSGLRDRATRPLPSSGPWTTFPRVAGYEILDELGRGGMGVVYKARHLRLDRLVALKMLLTGGHASRSELERFRGEAQAVGQLHHANIVQIFEVGQHDHLPFLCLEYVDGDTLSHHLNKAPQSPSVVAVLVEQIARGIAYAHQRGIVHRDLKPSNILLVSGRVVSGEWSQDTTHHSPLTTHHCKITDFGLAKRLAGEQGGVAAGLTRSGMILGTPSYMAPEQARGQGKEAGPAIDIYALGTILYECLTGRPPFQGPTALDTIDLVISSEPVPPTSLQPSVPRDLETICLKCLEKEPTRRYASAADLAEDLQRFLAHEPILARPVRAWERGIKWARRKPALAALVGIGVLAILSLLASGIAYTGYLQERTQVAEQQLNERRRVDGLRGESNQLLRQAKDAMTGEAWGKADNLLSQAIAKTGSEADLQDLKSEAERLQAEVHARLNVQMDRQKALDKYQQFRDLRDRAVFHATLSVGDNLAANLNGARDAAQQALDLYGVDPEGEAGPMLDTPLHEPEKEDIVLGCYELMLVLADVIAQPLPQQESEDLRRQARQALAVLDRAARWGPATQAYHLRRARYQEQAGDDGAARDARSRAQALAPTTALDHYLVGSEEYMHGNQDRAIPHFDATLALQPDHFWARYFLAVCYLGLDRGAEAKASLTACLAQKRDFLWGYLMLGFTHSRLQEYTAAENNFDHALKLLADRPDRNASYLLYANRGALRFDQGKLAEAIQDLDRAIPLRPDQYHAYASLAQVYQKQENWTRARENFDRALKLAEPLVKAQELEPAVLALLYRNRSQLHVQRKDWEAALDDLQRAIGSEPDPKAAAVDQVRRARILQVRNRLPDSLDACKAALKLRPDYAPAYLCRADLLLKFQRDEEAVEAFDLYLKCGGKPFAHVYRSRAMALVRLGREDVAILDYHRALDLEPDDATTLGQRGWLYLTNKNPRFALPDFENAIRLDRANSSHYIGRGNARLLLGSYQLAPADAEAAVRCQPDSPQRLCQAARILAQVVGQLDSMLGRMNQENLDQRRRYQDRALEWIVLALDRLPPRQQKAFWLKEVATDSAFQPIRRSARFIELEARYTSPSK